MRCRPPQQFNGAEGLDPTSTTRTLCFFGAGRLLTAAFAPTVIGRGSGGTRIWAIWSWLGSVNLPSNRSTVETKWEKVYETMPKIWGL